MTKLAKSIDLIKVLLEIGDSAKANQVASLVLKDIVQLADVAKSMREGIACEEDEFGFSDEDQVAEACEAYDKLMKG